jgi:2,4-dienoyl-CoA reductase-like NADH-dependent reductase (Old Yellow Enzyme family)
MTVLLPTGTSSIWDAGPWAAAEGGWKTVGPSSLPFADGYAAPEELSREGIAEVTTDFAAAMSAGGRTKTGCGWPNQYLRAKM